MPNPFDMNLRNETWDPREADRLFGKSPCEDCPHGDECAALGLEMTCESFALAEWKALQRICAM